MTKSNVNIVLLFIALIKCHSSIYAQEAKNENNNSYRYLSLKTHFGSHLYTGQTLSKELDNGYRSLELRLGFQNSDPDHWTNKYYNATNYGIGLYTAYIGTPDVLGTPTALFGFINFPFGNFSKNTSFNTNGALGLTFDATHYHEKKNPKNDAIGGPLSIYVNIGFGVETIVNRNIDLLYGIDYTHFSNGRITLPNYGLNMFGLNLGIKYNYVKTRKNVDQDSLAKNSNPSPRYKKINSSNPPHKLVHRLNILTSFGIVESDLKTPNKQAQQNTRYYTFSGYIEYALNFNVKHGIQTGLDVFYDESLVEYFPDSYDPYMYGYHFGYNYTFGKMILKLDLGGYIGPNGNKGKEKLWTRAALQYNVFDWLGLHLGLKTKQGFTADFGEFGLIFHPLKS